MRRCMRAQSGTAPEEPPTMNDVRNDAAQPERFTRALGAAVVEAWSALPRAIQQMIFEKAVLAGHQSERDESLREQLATFLHERHPRTANGGDPANADPAIRR